MIKHLAVKGYRLFKSFETDLQPDINVLIGANGSGKSTLVEFLRIVQSCAVGALAPFVETRQLPGILLHPNGSDSIAWRLDLSLPGWQGEGAVDCSYEVAVRALRTASVAFEKLQVGVPAPLLGQAVPQVVFEASNGQGVMYEAQTPATWSLKPGETMLGRATDPTLHYSSRVRYGLLRWQFYTDLYVNRMAPIRSPQPLAGWPELNETGSNLAAVLLALLTNLDYEEQRVELESFLSSAVPDFERITTTLDPTGQFVVLQWRERGVNANLSGADLSDGILRLLCLAAIALNPTPPTLICLDEPEIGLHPRLLPLVGGLLQRAAERSQVIVLTHSPDLLYDMPLESIAVMRKRDGEAQIVWPRNHDLLCDILTEEIAGEPQVDRERLRLAFTSGEMDELE